MFCVRALIKSYQNGIEPCLSLTDRIIIYRIRCWHMLCCILRCLAHWLVAQTLLYFMSRWLPHILHFDFGKHVLQQRFFVKQCSGLLDLFMIERILPVMCWPNIFRNDAKQSMHQHICSQDLARWDARSSPLRAWLELEASSFCVLLPAIFFVDVQKLFHPHVAHRQSWKETQEVLLNVLTIHSGLLVPASSLSAVLCNDAKQLVDKHIFQLHLCSRNAKGVFLLLHVRPTFSCSLLVPRHLRSWRESAFSHQSPAANSQFLAESPSSTHNLNTFTLTQESRNFFASSFASVPQRCRWLIVSLSMLLSHARSKRVYCILLWFVVISVKDRGSSSACQRYSDCNSFAHSSSMYVNILPTFSIYS